MAKRGRPPKAGRVRVFNIKLRLREGVDDDLIAYLDQFQPGQRVAAIKIALRSGGMTTKAVSPGDPDADDDDLGIDFDDFLFD